MPHGPEVIATALVTGWFFLAYLNAAEAAFLAVNDVRIQHRAEGGDARAEFLARQLADRERFLSFLLLCSKLAVCLLALGAYRLALRQAGDPVSQVLVLGALFVFVVVSGVKGPTALGARFADKVAVPLVWPLRILERFPLRGPTSALRSLVKSTGRFLGSPLAGVEPGFKFDLLRMLLEASERRGVLDPTSHRMLQSILSLGDIPVRQAMVPLDDMVMVPAHETAERAAGLAGETGFSRLPLHENGRESVIGYVHVRDLFVKSCLAPGTPARELRQEILEIAPDDSLVSALRLFRSSRYHMACVREPGGPALGVLTIEDVLERIVGDIEDEHDLPIEAPEEVAPGEWLVDAQLALEELEEATGVALPAEDVRTLGGFLVALHGATPGAGQELSFEAVSFVVEDADDLAVKKVRVITRPEEDPT